MAAHAFHHENPDTPVSGTEAVDARPIRILEVDKGRRNRRVRIGLANP